MASTSYKISIVGDASSLKNATDQAEGALGGLDDKIQKTTGGKGNDPLEPIGKKIDMSNLMQAGEMVAGMGDKLLEMGKRSVESSANINAMNATFKQTFGDSLPYAEGQVDKLSKAYDILPNRIKPSYQQFTAMFKGLGLDTKDAADKATQAMRISANAAAYYDKSLEDSNSALQSFVKGNYEGGEAIGVFANDTQMSAYATKNNLIPATEGAKQASEELSIANEKASKKLDEAIKKHGEGSIEAREASLKLKDVQDKIAEELGPQQQKWADLDEATKQAVRLDYAENMLQQAGAIDEVGKMTGQASRESGEYENQMGNMKQAIEDTYAELGNAILPLVLDVLKAGVPILQAFSEGWQSLPTPVQGGIMLLGGVIVVLSQLAPIMAGVGALMTAMGVTTIPALLVALAPVAGIIAGITLAIGAVILVMQNWDAIIQWLNGVLAFFGTSTDAIWKGIQNVITTVTTAVSAFIQEVWGSITQWWSDNQGLIERTAKIVWEGIQNVIQTVTNIISPFLQLAWNTIKNTISAVWDSIKIVVSTSINAVLGIIKAVMRMINGDWDGAWSTIQDVANTVWQGIKALIERWFGGIWQYIVNKANDIKNTLSNAWNSIKQTAGYAWSAIKEAIVSPFRTAWDIISGIVDKIKSAFNFDIQFPRIQIPHIPLPHFEVVGEFSPLEGKFPGFNVNWYKTGGVFSDPSLIGVGEAGKEAVIPLKDSVLGTIGRSIADTMTPDQRSGGGQQVVTINVDWTGDVDSPERIRDLAQAINDEFLEMDRGF